MKIIVVEPGKTPYKKDIEQTLKAMQETVGGYIEAVYPWDDPVALVCDEEGKLTGKQANRCLRDKDGRVVDIMCGTFFLAGIGEEDFTDIPGELEAKYLSKFEPVEEFIRIGGSVFVSAYKDGKCVRFMEEIISGKKTRSRKAKRA